MIYSIQVIAREDKGWRGVEYNKSPETFFKTSRKKKDLSPVKIQDINRGVDAVKEVGTYLPERIKRMNILG